MEKNKPEKKFVAGAIAATIWANAGKGRNGEEVHFRTVAIDRRYRDKNNEWKSTNSFRVNDLPRVSVVLNKAYEYLVLKEEGKEEGKDTNLIEVEDII